jgi:hypothetical protein
MPMNTKTPPKDELNSHRKDYQSHKPRYDIVDQAAARTAACRSRSNYSIESMGNTRIRFTPSFFQNPA